MAYLIYHHSIVCIGELGLVFWQGRVRFGCQLVRHLKLECGFPRESAYLVYSMQFMLLVSCMWVSFKFIIVRTFLDGLI